MPNVSAPDSLILLLYFFFTLSIGLSLKPLLKSGADFLQAGRAMPAWICGLAMTAASLGSQELIGMGAAGARYGFASIPFYLLGAVPAILFSGLFLIPAYRGSNARTLPEYLGLRYDEKNRVLHACLFAVMAVFSAGVSLYAMARVFVALHVFEVPLRSAGIGTTGTLIVLMAVPAAFVLAYLLMGGLTGNLYGLVLQFFVMVAGLFPVVLLGLKQLGGWGGLETAAGLAWFAQGHGGAGHGGFATFALAAGLGLVFSACTWCADFRILQAPMAAKDVGSARNAALIAAAVRVVVPLLVILPAIVALAMPTPRTTIVIHSENGAIYHDITVVPREIEQGQGLVPARMDAANDKPVKDSEGHTVLNYAMAAPNIFLHFLPTGLMGLGIAALLAAMMSGVSASVTACSTVFTCDLFPLFRRGIDADGKQVAVMRWAVLGTMLLGLGLGCLAMRFDRLADASMLIFSVVVAPLLAALLLGVLWKRATGHGAFAGLIAGALAALLHHGLALPNGEVRGIHGGWIAVVQHPPNELALHAGTLASGLVAALVATAVVSKLTKPREAESAAVPVRAGKSRKRTEAAWRKRPEAIAVAILITAVAVCAIFA